MLSGSKVFLVGQVDGDIKELLSPEGYKSLGFTLKVPANMVGRGWYDTYSSIGKYSRSEYPKSGDWVLLWGYSIGRRKVPSKDPNLRDTYKTVLRGSIDDLMNMNLLVMKGQDYLEQFSWESRGKQPEAGPTRKAGGQNKGADDLEKIISDIERTL